MPSSRRIDIDEIYREAERNRGSEILENWVRNFRFRFQVKHLLIATAVLAIALTLVKLQLFWTALIVLIMVSVAGLYVYLQWEEKKQQAEAERKREELYARRRAQFAAKNSGHVVGTPEVPARPRSPKFRHCRTQSIKPGRKRETSSRFAFNSRSANLSWR